ncbi:MAG: DUF983 domain-containing protein [Bacteroidota bacterium]|mgnify:CR=1 FL=1
MGLFKKGSKGYSIFNFKCPTCHEGDLFETGTWSFQRPTDMPKRCPKCGQSYSPEPGFYYGAMFISYIISGWFCLGFAALMIFGFGMSINGSFLLLIFVAAIFFIWYFRFSRAVWININYHYDPEKAKLAKEA